MLHRLNSNIRRMLEEKVAGYAMQSHESALRLDDIRRRSGRQDLIRLDLGINPDGCDPVVARAGLDTQADYLNRLHYYPDFDERHLTHPVAALHCVPPEWVVLSAGLDQMIALLADSFLETGDTFVQVIPSFFLFEAYSRRAGANPLYVTLDAQDSFDWTGSSVDQLVRILRSHSPRPKLLWLANPNNPTGRLMDPDMLHRIVDIAGREDLCVVVDEAYAEYCDPSGAVASASSLLGRHVNMVVLRTFSKAWGLANVRIAYALAGNYHIREALRAAHLFFPIDNRALFLARHALDRMEWLDTVRCQTRLRRDFLVDRLLYKGLDAEFEWVPSQTGIMMLRHKRMDAPALITRLEDQGVLVAPVSGGGRAGNDYVRVTLGTPDDLGHLARALELCVEPCSTGTGAKFAPINP